MWLIFLGAYARVCLIPTKDLLYPSVSLPTSLSGGVQSENKSFPSVGLHVWFWWRLGEFCQLSGTNRCQHLFRYRLGNSLVAAVAVLTGLSASHPFASLPASLSVTFACCRLGLKMRVSRIKSSEKNPTALHILIFMSEFLLDNCYIWSCFWN